MKIIQTNADSDITEEEDMDPVRFRPRRFSEEIEERQPEEEPVRFRQPLPSPIYQNDAVGYAELEAIPKNHEKSSEPKKDCLEITVNFILDYWKIILLAVVAFIILLLVIFIIVFFVTIKSSKGHTEAPVVTSTGIPSTVSTNTTHTTQAITKVPYLVTVLQHSTTPPIIRSTTMPPTTTESPTPALTCPNGFTQVNEKCWKMIIQPSTFSNATSTCQKMFESSLVHIKTAQDNQALAQYLANQNLIKIWIGLQCPGIEKYVCEWNYNEEDTVDGYSNFEKGYPDWFVGDCISFNKTSGLWTNEYCDLVELPYVCESELRIEFETTTEAFQTTATTGFKISTATVGGSTSAESFSPVIISNTITITTTTVPSPPCPTEFSLLNNKCWQLITTPDTATNATSTCSKTFNSHLITMNSAQDNTALQNFLETQNFEKIWIGLQCPGIEDYLCQWNNDEKDTVDNYSSFEKGYPDWFVGNCISFNKTSGLWTNEFCDLVKLPYVCEVPPYET